MWKDMLEQSKSVLQPKHKINFSYDTCHSEFCMGCKSSDLLPKIRRDKKLKHFTALTCSVRARFASKKDLIVPISSQQSLKRQAYSEISHVNTINMLHYTSSMTKNLLTNSSGGIGLRDCEVLMLSHGMCRRNLITFMKNSLADAGIISDPKSFAVGKRHLNQRKFTKLILPYSTSQVCLHDC